MKELTPRLEDVIMALWEMEQGQKVVRVKDLERFFGIRTSSAIDFIRALERRNLLHHEKYGYIELTAAGNAQARTIHAKRTLLTSFFSHVLQLDPLVAEREACSFEHHVHKDTQKSMERLIAFFDQTTHTPTKISALFRQFCESGDLCERAELPCPLSEFETPGTCLIQSIRCDSRRKRILSEMGLSVGITARVSSPSPLGDPIALLLSDARDPIFISLKDAALVLVRLIAGEDQK